MLHPDFCHSFLISPSPETIDLTTRSCIKFEPKIFCFFAKKNLDSLPSLFNVLPRRLICSKVLQFKSQDDAALNSFFHLPEGFQPPLMADFFTRRLVVDKVLTSLAGYFTQFLLNDPDLVHAVVGEVDEAIGRVKTSC